MKVTICQNVFRQIFEVSIRQNFPLFKILGYTIFSNIAETFFYTDQTLSRNWQLAGILSMNVYTYAHEDLKQFNITHACVITYLCMQKSIPDNWMFI